MLNHGKILSSCITTAEAEFFNASLSGFADPVVGLSAMDPADPDNVEVRLWERSELASIFDGKCTGAASALASEPDPEKPLTIIVTTPAGVTIQNRPLPPTRN